MSSICVHLRNLWMIIFPCLFCGCNARSATDVDRLVNARPFAQTLPGSTVSFEMRPVEVGDTAGGRRALWFAATETTWDAYDVFYLRLDENPDDVAAAGAEGPDAITRPTHPYAPPDRGWGHGGYPVISVTFFAAQKYCDWLTEKTGRRYRLPTVAEWRDALWGSCGTGMPPPHGMYWFATNAGGRTNPVATLRANREGLYDVAGNVAEWCVGPAGEPVVCGGSFRTDPNGMSDHALDHFLMHGERPTAAWRAGDPSFPPSEWWLSDAPFVGFRVVCEGPPG